jgi:hypothetical protein
MEKQKKNMAGKREILFREVVAGGRRVGNEKRK